MATGQRWQTPHVYNGTTDTTEHAGTREKQVTGKNFNVMSVV